jgi:hypothetical protein
LSLPKKVESLGADALIAVNNLVEGIDMARKRTKTPTTFLSRYDELELHQI